MFRPALLWILAAALALGLIASPATVTAQDDGPKPTPKQEDPLDEFDDLDSASEDLTGQPKKGKENDLSELDRASKKLRGEDPDAEGGAEANPVEILNKVRDLMLRAEEELNKAGNWRASEEQRKAIEEIEKLLNEAGKGGGGGGAGGSSAGGGSSGSSSSGGSDGSAGGAGGAQGESLEGIEKAMREALEGQGKSAEQIEKMMNDSAQKMKEASREMQKIMKECDKAMQGGLDNIEKLIKMAKVYEVPDPNQPQGKQPKDKKPQNQPKNPNNDENSNNPAEKPYDPEKKNPPENDLRIPRTPGKKWGDLPPRVRDEILQHRAKDFPSEYADLLERFFKILSEQEE